jgi:hypothetical protein
MRLRTLHCVLVVLALAGWSQQARAQEVRGQVVDQTGLPLPGATVQIVAASSAVASTTTGADGTFAFDTSVEGEQVSVSLQGFETTTVARSAATRIVLPLAHTTEVTQVTAPTVVASSPTAPSIGSTLSAETVARMPSTQMKVRESLPLLPSVIRGNDGLLRLGGARPYDSPLLIDGFDVTDPATGTSSINLPFETIKAVQVLRDPTDVRLGDLIGAVVRIETTPGQPETKFGFQSVMPRPRLATPGFGRVDAISPRVYYGGATTGRKVAYFLAAEYDFERTPVPGVTIGTGPTLVASSETLFGRVDLQATRADAITFETFIAPTATQGVGLSPRRAVDASMTLDSHDWLIGLTERHVTRGGSVLTLQAGAMASETTLSPGRQSASVLTPGGWTGNWFSRGDRRAVRYSGTIGWERVFTRRRGSHDLSATAGYSLRQLHGTIVETPITIVNDAGQATRSISFGAPGVLSAGDRPQSASLRDLWTVTNRLEIEGGARVDRNPGHGTIQPAGRVGFRYFIDPAGDTVLRAGVGRFVGAIPLAISGFASYPTRVDRLIDPASGAILSENLYSPTIGNLRLPTALGTTIRLERRLAAHLESGIGFTNRTTSFSPTLDVPAGGGSLEVRSTGRGTYREVEVSVRRLWDNHQELFASYVRSRARGEVNDFSGLFQQLDTPLLQQSGIARLPADAPNRIITWATFNLPREVVVSPVFEWHSGFPYSPVDTRYLYSGAPNRASFPQVIAVDLLAFKTVTVYGRRADVGIQFYNLTNHFNPRDVYPVEGTSRFGTFTNGVGTIARGYLMLKW